jgi:hypothetical protein
VVTDICLELGSWFKAAKRNRWWDLHGTLSRIFWEVLDDVLPGRMCKARAIRGRA